MRYRCNSCLSEYSNPLPNGSEYLHACSNEVIEHAVCDDDGKVITPEKRTPRENGRNEHPHPSIVYIENKPHKPQPHHEERGQVVYVPCEASIIAEGLGVTVLGE